MRDLRLVRGVGGKELAARNQRVNHDRPIVRIRARAKECSVALRTLRRALAEELDDLAFGVGAWNVEIAFEAVFRWYGGEKIVNGFGADLAQHDFAVGFRLWKIAHEYL